jgi:hypothetical protein
MAPDLMSAAQLKNISQKHILYNLDGNPLYLEGFYAGKSCFICLAGPSFSRVNTNLLSQRGIVTASVNNVAATNIRPNFWFSVDEPKSFCDIIWKDPGILKFVASENKDKSFYVRDSHNRLQASNILINSLPSVVVYHRNNDFNEKRFLTESTVNWGMHTNLIDPHGNKGNRSVLYVVIRILFYLGFRQLFLLGADFYMNPDGPQYCFDQKKDSTACRSNNSCYETIRRRLGYLRPILEKYDCKIYNCTENSKLDVFEHISLEKALKMALNNFPSIACTSKMYNAD